MHEVSVWLRHVAAALAPACALAANAGAAQYAVERAPLTKPVWRADWHGYSDIPPLVIDSLVVVAGRDRLAAFSRATGQPRWISPVQRDAGYNGARLLLVRAGLIVAASGVITATDARTGAPVWSAMPHSLATSAVAAIDDGLVFVGTYQHRVQAFDLHSGAVRWTADVAPTCAHTCGVGGVSVSGDTVYAGLDYSLLPPGTPRNHLVALNRRTGVMLWAEELRGAPTGESGVLCPPLVIGRLLVVCDFRGGRFLAIDRFTLKPRWELSTNWNPGPSKPLIVRGDTIVGASTDGFAYAILATTGALLWKTGIGNAPMGPRLCGDRVAVATLGARILDLHTGRILAQLDTRPDPVLSGVDAGGGLAFVQTEHALLAMVC